ncbi:hypothetical protein ATY37_20335 [Vibrio cidicii]|uniref:Uncharacterized protein n=1 Tax=Vibrio cidicii TaxID=1763883 RepID=A0A151KTZ1_9VIBR|nr:hypothetical protein ATY37_20335 [Vibrio cidicii]
MNPNVRNEKASSARQFKLQPKEYNAALRGECRLNQPSADHFHHQKQPHTKNATRHESLLNALLCLSFNGLRFNRTKINSTLIYKQKPKRRKPK